MVHTYFKWKYATMWLPLMIYFSMAMMMMIIVVLNMKTHLIKKILIWSW